MAHFKKNRVHTNNLGTFNFGINSSDITTYNYLPTYVYTLVNNRVHTNNLGIITYGIDNLGTLNLDTDSSALDKIHSDNLNLHLLPICPVQIVSMQLASQWTFSLPSEETPVLVYP